MPSFLSMPQSLRALLLLLLVLPCVLADPATLHFTDCSDQSGDTNQKLHISTVYAQVLDNSTFGTYLNLTVLGNSSQVIQGFTNTSSSLGKSGLHSSVF